MLLDPAKQGPRSGEITRLPPIWGGLEILASMPYVGWVCCWFFPLHREVFLRVLRFPLSLKTNNSKFQFDLVTHGHVLTSSHETPKCSVCKQITITKFIETTRAFGTNVNTRWLRFRFHSEFIHYRKICDRRYVFVTVVAPLYETSKIECKAVKTAFNYKASNKTVFATYR